MLAISATCFDLLLFFFKMFSTAKLRIFTFLIGYSNRDGLSVHFSINASLLHSTSSLIVSRYSFPFLWTLLPVLKLNNTFSFTASSNGFSAVFITALIFSRSSLSLVIPVWRNSFVPSIALSKSDISKTWLIYFA